MIRVKYSWLIAFMAGIFSACHDTELLETYEEVKETTQLDEPISFDAYISSSIEDNASTRANVSYLTAIDSKNNDVGGTNAFLYIPCLGLSLGNNGGYGVDSDTSKTPYKLFQTDFRHGWTALNSYIVGLYGFAYNVDSWSTVVSTNNAEANLMTNQPLFHVPKMLANGNVVPYNQEQVANSNYTLWDYEPRKYWPNYNGSKVAFIAYYPFQDFEGGDYYRDGNGTTDEVCNEILTLNGTTYQANYDTAPHREANLTCIKPPVAGATGTSAYTFNFQQKDNVEEHIDFMMGIREYTSKPNNNQVSLQLNHTLCAVKFNFNDLSANFGIEAGQTMEIKVNSMGFKGLKTQGDVSPNTDGTFNWFNLVNHDGDEDTYMVTFEDNTNGSDRLPWIKAGVDDRPTFTYDGSKWTYTNNTADLIYNKNYSGSDTNLKGKVYGQNSRGFRYLLLVIPQAVADNADAYFEMNYDLSYSWTGGKNSFKNTISRIRLSDSAKSSGDTTQLFIANKMLTFNISITPTGIGMDVSETNWEDDEERQLPIENKETGDNGGE